MQIDGAPQPGANITLSTSSPVQKAWQVGQLLKASVVTANTNGTASLRINGVLFDALTQTRLPAAPGQALQLQVVRAGETPVLRVLDTSNPADPLTRALRTALPRQGGLRPLLANIAALAQTSNASPTRPAAHLVQLGKQVFRNLPDVETVSQPGGLRRALLDSGIFLEAKLAQGQTGVQSPSLITDFKAGLLRLFSGLLALRQAGDHKVAPPSNRTTTAPPAPAPPLRGIPLQPQAAASASLTEPQSNAGAVRELLPQVEAGLARVQLSQLASLPGNDYATPMWTVELPVRREDRTDLFHLHIRRDRGGTRSTDAETWSVSLAFDLEGLGAVHARVTVVGRQVSLGLRVERAATASLFNRHLEELDSRFQQAGLELGDIRCHCGVPQDPLIPGGGHTLVDTKA